ncbi:hypothetical protein Pcinc_006719 [Petrolisthes cinctipes]|uniref:Uncharacterized protein n=1 Tax=Petrolisthes cinctipes TaxID=88211 RepID=A0AAE1GAU4_PETCI|nr:hypothetical protein Pcinc_006719 [Petrolisthes cinctipes]
MRYFLCDTLLILPARVPGRCQGVCVDGRGTDIRAKDATEPKERRARCGRRARGATNLLQRSTKMIVTRGQRRGTQPGCPAEDEPREEDDSHEEADQEDNKRMTPMKITTKRITRR